MKEIAPPDSHYLTAAIGWLELGSPEEAGREINQIHPSCLEHPDVLEVRWQICAASQNWKAALDMAEKLVAAAPDRSSGWIHRAYSLRRVENGGLQKAWDALLPAFDKFSGVTLIPYNLACYAAQFGRLDEAWSWLRKAMDMSGRLDAIKAMALADSDLQALWDRIREL